MGGREDGSAGTNHELKTAAAPLGDSGSFLWSSGGGPLPCLQDLGAAVWGDGRESRGGLLAPFH